MNFGFDIHGTIDAKPQFFKTFSQRLLKNDHSVHIITGSMETETIKSLLKDFGIEYTHFFSVSDYLITQGIECKFSSLDNPWFSNLEWDKVKSEYCQREKIDIHFDDSKVYGNFFTTPYFRII